MKNWRKPPDFRGLFPDQSEFSNALLNDYLRAEHGLPIAEKRDPFEICDEIGAEPDPHDRARHSLNQAITSYLKKNDPTCSAFNEIQADLGTLGRVFYFRRGYQGLKTLFSKWNSESIERDLLASDSFIEPIFAVHRPDQYALAHREARNNLRLFSEYIMNHVSQDHLTLLTSNGEFGRSIKNVAGLTIQTLVPLDLCVKNGLTGKPLLELETDESRLIAESYLLDFMQSWKCRPDIERIMVAMKLALRAIVPVIKDDPVPERILYISATKVGKNWKSAMQNVELSQESVLFIHCPFCGHAVMGEESAPEVNPCSHTLFLGTDEGFEYASDFFQSTCEEQLEEGYDPMNVHNAIANVRLPDAVCFTMVAPPVSMLNCHAAFIGFEQDE